MLTAKGENLERVDLSFAHVQERYRTKHVHRLHPYLGKFIPQLAEWFVRRYFTAGQTIVDPFVGSGTTLIEGNALGINAAGVDISQWNCLIAQVKTGRYDLALLRRETLEALDRTRAFSQSLNLAPSSPSGPAHHTAPFVTDSQYLNNWYSARALQEMLFYRSIVPEYHYQEVLMIILSRAARSARLIAHYDLARPQKTVRGEYYCIKHRRICRSTEEAFKFIERYSLDTLARVREFARLRTDATIEIYCADARTISFKREFDGVLTSPPYVGMIDYHETHRYAYELFPDIQRLDEWEIGKPSKGRGKHAQEQYRCDIAAVLQNIPLKKQAPIFVVANDTFNLYPEIAGRAGLEIVKIYERPVLKRTERDNVLYTENVFHMVKG